VKPKTARQPAPKPKAPAAAPKRASRPQARPRVVVETAVSELVTPKLAQWLGELEEAIPRVVGNTDSEAVHDLRVALRRIRSLLKTVRAVYGTFHTNLIRKEMARVADATGALRDEEVLGETLAALQLSPAAGAALAAWLHRRRHRTKALRASVVSLLQAGALQQSVEHLRALLSLPCEPKRDREVRRFARQIVLEAQANVDDSRSAEVNDIAGMHTLRIMYKRLRYSIEAFSQVLPPELRAWREVASKFQSVLGDLHDHDVAIDTMRKSDSLRSDARIAVLRALRERRDQLGARYQEMAGLLVQGLELG
jgi:CHAD domain-containing protein